MIIRVSLTMSSIIFTKSDGVEVLSGVFVLAGTSISRCRSFQFWVCQNLVNSSSLTARSSIEMERHCLLILKSPKAYIHELTSNILIRYVYGFEQMLCCSSHAKRSQFFYKRT
ncbi:uncharacterized protein LOC104444668 isoform X2 [Eucalyptus grandis]|uniref:uncharacterized protein LOC104444668 isoform X2 n=1 Tax=Eucalyptus grandis TaxID=71139 RepID=UPI00192F0D90|nr:uncharacterized protein LOC104444668 isoform X2 [Eucalyptus grandis]